MITSKGKLPEGVLLDTEDLHLLQGRSWRVCREGYVRCNINIKGSYKTLRLHRLVMQALPGEEVDHINGNPRDNRKSNLRICTRTQNVRNRRKKLKGATSRYIGVSKLSTGDWLARITRRTKGRVETLYRERFKTEKDAGKAVAKNYNKFFGEYSPYWRSNE